MSATKGLVAFLLVFIVGFDVPKVDSQFDNSMILSIVNGMPIRDKLLFLAQALMDHPSVYQDLEDTLVAFLPIREYDKPPEYFLGYILPWVLNHLPDLLKNDTFKDVMRIFITELNAHNATDDWHLGSGNATLDRVDRDYFVEHLFSALDVDGMLADIFQLKGVRDFLHLDTTDGQTDKKCFDKTVTFIRSLFDRENSTSTASATKNEEMVCFSCEDLSDLSHCEAVERCNDNQICFLERYPSAEGHLHYRSGCKDRQICKQHNQTDDGRSTCLQCCENSFCNSHGCGSKGLPPRNSRGPLCLDCAHVKDPKECDQVTLCSSGESCHIQELKWGDDSLFHLGCQSIHQCSFEFNTRAHSSGSLAARSVPVCRSCCHGDFCNQNCTRQPQDNQQILIG
ncbi:uncharacterized protein LOC123542653 [Mercenaria mercenaria]|uniref:uncharacterized protein LOC123542653 n=1 Tax=Mercenaria mercenaria TaxID=6596 RepID=UPI00234E589E|nr:uncharacterized protein LOC123542653 [Mercenaria mercenaria]